MRFDTPLDLHHRVALAMEYIRNNPDRKRDFRPYFSYQLLNAPAFMLHTFFDTPHVAGRFLDAIGRAATMGVPADEEVEQGLTRQLLGCIGPDGFGYAEPGRSSPCEAIMHDQRELLFGLVALIRLRHSERALEAAQRLCRAFAAVTQATADVPGPALRADGSWAAGADWESFRYPPANFGRLVTALNQYYVVSKDAVALTLARRLVDCNLARCFSPEGVLTSWAGFHLHSVTGLVESIVEFGLLVNEHAYIRRGKAIYDVGLRPYRSDFGWVKENLANEANDGEANNTGDLLRTALLLGRAGYPEYFEQVERMLRNHLLASQLLDVDWIRAHEDANRPDEYDRTYHNIAERARGGFGFTSPNDWVTDQNRKAKLYPLNADIVQGSVQAIVSSWEQALMREPVGIKVNLFLTRQTDFAALTSHLPQTGRLEIRLLTDDNLLVRIPSWADLGAVSIRVNNADQPVQVAADYFLIPNLQRGDYVEVDFPTTHTVVEEAVNYQLYQVGWLGDTVVSLTPRGGRLPLYI